MNHHLNLGSICRFIVNTGFLTLILAPHAFAQADLATTRQRIIHAAQTLLDAQPTDAGTHRKVTIGQPDSRALNIQCTEFEAFLPAATRLWGNTQIGIRCLSNRNWQIFIPAEVAVHGTYVVAARSMSAGETISQSDLTERSGELTRLPSLTVVHPSAAVGKSLTTAVLAEQPIRSDLLRVAPAIQSGQSVRVLVKGQGFQVESEGRAISQAAEGQVGQVRLATGQIVSGIAYKGLLVISSLDR